MHSNQRAQQKIKRKKTAGYYYIGIGKNTVPQYPGSAVSYYYTVFVVVVESSFFFFAANVTINICVNLLAVTLCAHFVIYGAPFVIYDFPPFSLLLGFYGLTAFISAVNCMITIRLHYACAHLVVQYTIKSGQSTMIALSRAPTRAAKKIVTYAIDNDCFVTVLFWGGGISTLEYANDVITRHASHNIISVI